MSTATSRVLISGALLAVAELAALGIALGSGSLTWRIAAGSFAAMSGLWLLFNFSQYPFVARDRLLKISAMLNPGASLVCAGLSLLFWDFERQLLLILAAITAIVFVVIGFFLFLAYAMLRLANESRS